MINFLIELLFCAVLPALSLVGMLLAVWSAVAIACEILRLFEEKK